VTQTDQLVTSQGERVVPTLVDYLQVLRRRLWMFLAVVILVPAIAVVLTMMQAPAYKASAQVLLDQQTVTGGQASPTDPAREAQTQAELARVPAVASRAINAARVRNLTPAEFLKASSAAPTLGSDFLTFSMTNSDPAIARRLATTYAAAYVDYRQDQDMQDLKDARAAAQRQLKQLETAGLKGSAEYRNLVREDRRLATLAALRAPTAKVVRPADQATKVGPKIIRNEMIGLALGLVLGLALAFLWDALDTRIRSVETLREGLGLRLLGRLPSPARKLQKDDQLVMLAAPLGHEAEAFRVLRASFDYANADYQARTIMVSSAVGGEGKSTTVANLAVALARAGRRVVLIDSDLRRPSLHRFFGLDQHPGLIDVELGHVELEEALRPVPLRQWDATAANGSRPAGRRQGRLEILTAGHVFQAPDELGVELTVAGVAKSLQDHADLVLIDAAPLLPVGDALALSAHVDALVLVVRLDSLRPSAFDDLRRTLASSPARKLGFILTGAETSDAYTHFYRYATPGRRGDEEVQITYESTRAPDE
jgi:polysaccharide biosynthesis transport protein